MAKPTAIRYPKNVGEELYGEYATIENEPWLTIKKGDKINILAVGPNMLKLALKCALEKDGVGVISVRQLKPLCKDVLERIKTTKIITLEENSVIGGFGSFVSGYFCQTGECVRIRSLGVGDAFVRHGTVEKQLEENLLTETNLSEIISEMSID